MYLTETCANRLIEKSGSNNEQSWDERCIHFSASFQFREHVGDYTFVSLYASNMLGVQSEALYILRI